MRRYKVVGKPVQIAPGEELMLTREQVAARRHAVRDIRKAGKAGGPVLVEATQMLTFKVGEVVWLDGVPKHAAAELFDVDEAAEAAAAAQAAEKVKAAQEPDRVAAEKAQIAELARKEYAGSAELQAKFASADEYIASLG